MVEAGGGRPVAWQDVTARVGPVLWPKSVTRSFWTRSQVDRYLARTFPRGSPEIPPIDFARRRLILVAAGPRSSDGYGVEILSVTDRRGDVRVLARETTPSLARPEKIRADLPVPPDHDSGDAQARLRPVARPVS